MRKRVWIALGFVALLAAVPVISAVLAPASPSSSPYLSAFGTIGGQEALANTKCNNKACCASHCGGKCITILRYNCFPTGHSNCGTAAC